MHGYLEEQHTAFREHHGFFSASWLIDCLILSKLASVKHTGFSVDSALNWHTARKDPFSDVGFIRVYPSVKTTIVILYSLVQLRIQFC